MDDPMPITPLQGKVLASLGREYGEVDMRLVTYLGHGLLHVDVVYRFFSSPRGRHGEFILDKDGNVVVEEVDRPRADASLTAQPEPRSPAGG